MLGLLLESARALPEVAELWPGHLAPESAAARRLEILGALLPGDVLCVSNERSMHHVAMAAGGFKLVHFIHGRQGLSEANALDPTVVKRLARVWRFMVTPGRNA